MLEAWTTDRRELEREFCDLAKDMCDHQFAWTIERNKEQAFNALVAGASNVNVGVCGCNRSRSL